MTTEVFEAAVIFQGYRYRQRLVADSAIFPQDGVFAAQVRASVESATILATLTSGAGINWISDTEIEIDIPAGDTAGMAAGSVVIDFVRTDTDPDQHLQFLVEVPVRLPVTRGL